MAYTIAYSGTAGAAGAKIIVSGSATLANLLTGTNGISSNTTWATVNGSSVVFNGSLSIDSTGTSGTATFTAASCTLIFPQAYTLNIPNASAQSVTSTVFSDVGIIYDGSAKAYNNSINYGTHTWTRVVWRSQTTTGRSDFSANNGCVFIFDNVQLTCSSTNSGGGGASDYIHLYNNNTTTVQGISVTGLGGGSSSESFEVGSATSTTTTFQGLTIGGNFGYVTVNNGGGSYAGTQDFRSLSWPLATSWTFNYGSGGGAMFITNPNKPSGWTAYVFGGAGTGNLTERYSYDVIDVDAANAAITGVNVGAFRSGAFIWTTTTASTGKITQQYITTATLVGAAGATPTTYSTTFTIAAWLYGYNTVVGSRTFVPTGSGIADTMLMPTDVTTLSLSAAAALTSLTTLDDLYDTSRRWNTLNSTNIQVPSLGTNVVVASGKVLNLGSYNLVINSGTTTAGSAFAVSGSTMTIYAGALAPGAKFASFTSTGTVTVSAGVAITTPFVTTSTVSNSGTINAQYTDSVGAHVVVSVTGLVANSRIQIYNVTDATEVYNNTVSGTSYSQFYTYTANKTFRLRVAYASGTTAYLPFQTNGLLTASGVAFAVTQVADAVYNANAIDGSTCTEFASDLASHIYIDVTSSGNATTIQRLYAWYQFDNMSSTGISTFFGGITAQDTINYVVVTSIASIFIYNTKSVACIISGANFTRDDDASIIASNYLQLNPGKAYLSGAGTITTQLSAIAANTNLIPALL